MIQMNKLHEPALRMLHLGTIAIVSVKCGTVDAEDDLSSQW